MLDVASRRNPKTEIPTNVCQIPQKGQTPTSVKKSPWPDSKVQFSFYLSGPPVRLKCLVLHCKRANFELMLWGE
eukprot:305333-Amphidinium_carterae.1